MGYDVEPLVLFLKDVSTDIIGNISTKRLIFGWENCFFPLVILNNSHVGDELTSFLVHMGFEIKEKKPRFLMSFLIFIGERLLSYVALVAFQLVTAANIAEAIVAAVNIIRSTDPGVDCSEAVQKTVHVGTQGLSNMSTGLRLRLVVVETINTVEMQITFRTQDLIVFFSRTLMT